MLILEAAKNTQLTIDRFLFFLVFQRFTFSSNLLLILFCNADLFEKTHDNSYSFGLFEFDYNILRFVDVFREKRLIIF